MKAYKQEHIKAHNKQLLTTILKTKRAPLTKRQLSEEANLSIVTINKLIPELVESEEIVELAELTKTGGRYAQVYQFNANKELFVATQFIEEDNKMVIRLFVVNLLGEFLAQSQISADNLFFFLQELTKIKEEYPRLSLAVIGIPGVEIDGQLKIMDSFPFKNVALAEEIKTHIQVDSIIENDVNVATFGYASDTKEIVAGTYFPEKFLPGAALVIHQKIFKGYNNLSGEIKHLPSFKKYHYSSSTENIQQMLVEISQSMIAMYDPQELILYLSADKIKLLNQEALVKKLSTIFPYNVLPKLVFSSGFSTDYLQGLVKMGMDRLDQKENRKRFPT